MAIQIFTDSYIHNAVTLAHEYLKTSDTDSFAKVTTKVVARAVVYSVLTLSALIYTVALSLLTAMTFSFSFISNQPYQLLKGRTKEAFLTTVEALKAIVGYLPVIESKPIIAQIESKPIIAQVVTPIANATLQTQPVFKKTTYLQSLMNYTKGMGAYASAHKKQLAIATVIAIVAYVGYSQFSLVPIKDDPSCPISELRAILQKSDQNLMTPQAFKILEKIQGISCQNFLPWQKKFLGGTGYIDRIRPTDLQKSVQWGIDPLKRPYIAMKYVCDKISEIGATTLFQRYEIMENPRTFWEKLFVEKNPMVVGSHFEVKGCLPNLGTVLEDADKTKFLEILSYLFKGKQIIGTAADFNTTLSLAT